MKKIAIVVAILALTAPAMALNVTIGTVVGADCNVTLTYTADSNISAFALDCNVSDGNTITDIDNYFEGESVAGSKGFGIFPGTIDINSVTGQVDHNGTPVAPNDDPGALGGLGTSGVTLEMGALYEDGNQPDWTGILCELTVSGACKMQIALNSTRGGIVKEDSNDATTNLPITVVVPCVAGCTVPDVLDMNLVDANAALEGAGLGLGSVGTECNETIALGNVLSTNPAGGEQPSCGSDVDLVLSLSNIVPNVLNQTETDANSAITAAGFVASIGYGHDCSVTAGNVISQNPSGGATPDCGSTVNITVADGDVNVPNVVGGDETDANAAVTNAGLVANITYAHNCSVTAGYVISQNPTGTTEVSCGSTVDISVADGNTIVPYIIGMNSTDANAAIIAAGISVGDVNWVTSTVVEPNLVVSQTPSDGTEVSCNPTAVNYNLSSGCYPKCKSDYSTWRSIAGGNFLTHCWCNPRQCHGDTMNDRGGDSKMGYFYVSTDDLMLLNNAWMVLEVPQGPGIASISYKGVPGICADLKHDKGGDSKMGYFYVSTGDLLELNNYWMVKESPIGTGTPADCNNCP